MPKLLRLAVVAAAALVGSSASQAQTVGMVGSYHESNGIVVNIPQNPPIVVGCSQVGDARCHKKRERFLANPTAPFSFQKPTRGVPVVAQPATLPGNVLQGLQIPTVGGTGLAVGDPFLVPPFAFGQKLGTQVGIVLNSVTRQLDTAFTAVMPRTARVTQTRAATVTGTRTQPALTRRFSQMNWENPGNGQNNGLADTALFSERLAADTLITAMAGVERLNMRYTAGPREFGGTMALLLDGMGRLYLGGPNIDALIPADQRPAIATNPVGDLQVAFRTRNAAGWNWTTPAGQDPGQMRGFPGALAVNVKPACAPTPPITPPGCNEVDNFSQGIFQFPFGGAVSTKHMFALTTGTISIVRTGVRNGVQQTNTQTGMGYDTVGVSAMGGVQRNVGLVAGSYTRRLDAVPRLEMNTQLLGVNLKFTPEPGATVALVAGMGLLGLMATRRRA